MRQQMKLMDNKETKCIPLYKLYLVVVVVFSCCTSPTVGISTVLNVLWVLAQHINVLWVLYSALRSSRTRHLGY